MSLIQFILVQAVAVGLILLGFFGGRARPAPVTPLSPPSPTAPTLTDLEAVVRTVLEDSTFDERVKRAMEAEFKRRADERAARGPRRKRGGKPKPPATTPSPTGP
ncbi:MAG: hypothetical protein AAB463_02855 [Patescibacteria group bacterium]